MDKNFENIFTQTKTPSRSNFFSLRFLDANRLVIGDDPPTTSRVPDKDPFVKLMNKYNVSGSRTRPRETSAQGRSVIYELYAQA